MTVRGPLFVRKGADPTDLAFWFPKIKDAGLPVPDTRIVTYEPDDLIDMLDGKPPSEWVRLVTRIKRAAAELGWPVFLRTGHGSGKHQWRDTCYLERPADVAQHIANLVEWSAMVDLMSLPTRTWVVRRLIPTKPLFVCERFGGFPVTREFRYFVRDGKIEHVQPYWPPDAVEQGRPNLKGWEGALARASRLTIDERGALGALAEQACEAVGGGFWSVDLLQDAAGAWWLTDMADGDRSFRWEDTDGA